MKIISLLLLSFFLANQGYSQYGEISLVLKLKNGDSKITISPASLHNPIIEGTISKFEKNDNHTYILNTKTYGPTSIFFMIDRIHPIVTVLYPGNTDTIYIEYDFENNIKMEYKGKSKDIAMNSKNISQMLMDSHNLGNGGIENEGQNSQSIPFKTSLEYRDHYINYINQRINAITKNNLPKEVNYFFSQYFNNTHKSIYLTGNYYKSIKNYNLRIGLDTLQASLNIPKRTKEYYQSIIGTEMIDPKILTAPGYANLLRDIRQDSLIQLPNILDVPIAEYKNTLVKFFYQNLNSDNNFFYDYIIAGAFIDQIYLGKTIDSKKQDEITEYFSDKEISKYIINTFEEAIKTTDSSIFHLPYKGKNGDEVFETILSKYQDKVVIIDFWATWCGPCIDTFSEINKLKQYYKENNNVVFIYLTDESSDFTMWKDYTRTISGDHYYLTKQQMKSIYKKLGIKAIPYYVVTDRKNQVIYNSNNNGYMGNDVLKNWIESSLVSSSN